MINVQPLAPSNKKADANAGGFGELQDFLLRKVQVGIQDSFKSLKCQLVGEINKVLETQSSQGTQSSRGVRNANIDFDAINTECNDDNVVYDDSDGDNTVYDTCNNDGFAARLQRFPGMVEEGSVQEGQDVRQLHHLTRAPVPTVAGKCPAAVGLPSGGRGALSLCVPSPSFVGGGGIIDVDTFAILKSKVISKCSGESSNVGFCSDAQGQSGQLGGGSSFSMWDSDSEEEVLYDDAPRRVSF